MTDQQVRDEIVTMFIAGHETTANGLAWAWYLLAQNPEIADRLRAEADSALGGRSPAFADLPNLPYALQVFKESLRFYPPVPLIARQTTQDTVVGGHQMKKGTSVTISAYAMHHNPRYFADPERFDPDRFLPEREAALPRHVFEPFGGGPRICIGNHFALMEGQLLLATIAQRASLELASGQVVEPEPLITIRPKNGMPMTVRLRNSAAAVAEGQEIGTVTAS
jgi:cytochrome P450